MAKIFSIQGISRLLPVHIRSRLFIIIFLAVIPLMLLIVNIYEQQIHIRRTQEIQAEVEVARGIATSFSFYILGIHQQNYAIGQSIASDPSYTRQDVVRLLKNSSMYYPAIRNLSWVDDHGRVLISSQADIEGQDLSERPYFQNILMGRPWCIGDLTPTGIVTQAPTFVVATSIRDRHDKLLGAVVAAIEPSRLGELMFSGARPESGEYSIFDSQGNLVYDSAGRALSLTERDPSRQPPSHLINVLLSGQEISGIAPLGPAGEAWIVAQVPIPGIPYSAGARRPEAIVLGTLRRDLGEGLLVAALVLGIALLIAYLVDRTIVIPIQNLGRQAAGGEQILLEPNSNAPIEVRQLFEIIQRMKTNLTDRAKALQESEERYRTLFHNRHTPMLVLDPATFGIVDANQAAVDFYGWKQAELTSMKITDINPLPTEQVRSKINQAQNSATHQRFFFQHRLANGEIRDVEVHSGPIHWRGKDYIFSIINDITDQKRFEQALQLKSQMVELSYEPIFTWKLDGAITSWNQGCEQLYGYSREEAIGQLSRSLLKTVHPQSTENITQQLKQNGEWTGRYRQTTKSGKVLVVESRQQVMSIAGEWHVLETHRDITHRIQTETALQAALERARWLARFPEENPNPVLRIGSDMQILYINPTAKRLPWWSHCLEGQCLPDPLAQLVDRSILQKREVIEDVTLEERSYAVSVLPVIEEGYVNLYATDITGRKQAEVALRLSEERFNKAFNAGPGPLLITRVEDGVILEVNQSFERVFEYSREEALGKTPCDLGIHTGPGICDHLAQSIQHNQPVANYELDFRTKSGEIRQGSISTELIYTHSGIQMLIVVQDITERKRAEEELRASEARLRQLFDIGMVGILSLDESGMVRDANPALLSLLGYSRDELISGHCAVECLLPEEYRPLERQTLAEVLVQGTSQPREQEFLRKDGTRAPVLVGYTLLEGRPKEFVEFVIDLSSLKAAQEAQKVYAEKLKRSNRDLEQFAFVASHDLQEPLRKIKFFSETLEKRLENSLNEENQDTLERMVKAAKRMQSMINDLLELSRVSTRAEPFREIDLQLVMEEVLENLENRIRQEKGQVSVSGLSKIEADPIQMQRLFQNLIGNALKYHRPEMPPQVKVTGKVTTGQKRGPAMLVVEIEDNGIGFEEQYRERIFQPFQRLHGRGEFEGTGMGLAICQKIVDRHHGKITARSTPGQGSTFFVELPIHQPS